MTGHRGEQTPRVGVVVGGRTCITRSAFVCNRERNTRTVTGIRFGHSWRSGASRRDSRQSGREQLNHLWCQTEAERVNLEPVIIDQSFKKGRADVCGNIGADGLEVKIHG